MWWTSFTIMFSESICQFWCKILILLLMLVLMPWIIIWKHALNWPLLFFLFFIWLCSVLVAAHGLFDLCHSMWDLLSCGMWDVFPEQGLNLGHLHWDHGVLATGPPGKSLSFFVSVNAFQKFNFIYLFMVGLGLCRYVQTFYSCGAGDSHCGDFYCCGAWALGTPASIIATRGLTCPLECGIFLNQGSNSCPQY